MLGDAVHMIPEHSTMFHHLLLYRNLTGPNLENSNEPLCDPENSDETLWEYLSLLWFSFYETSK